LMTRLSDRSDAHAPNTITLDCDIILRGSTRRYPSP
jgi:LacI family transcriptional regulator